jgi:hypothetical protein
MHYPLGFDQNLKNNIKIHLFNNVMHTPNIKLNELIRINIRN